MIRTLALLLAVYTVAYVVHEPGTQPWFAVLAGVLFAISDIGRKP